MIRNYDEWAKRVKEIRLAQDKSLESVSETTGLSIAFISNAERSVRGCSVVSAMRHLSGLNASLIIGPKLITTPSVISDILKTERIRQKLKVSELSRASGVSRHAIEKAENPSEISGMIITRLVKYIAALGLPINIV